MQQHEYTHRLNAEIESVAHVSDRHELRKKKEKPRLKQKKESYKLKRMWARKKRLREVIKVHA